MKPRQIVAVIAVALVASTCGFVLLRRGTAASKVERQLDPDPWNTPAKPSAARPRSVDGPTDERRVLIDDDPPGVLRLEGLVLGSDGEPVPGAAVSLSANPPRAATTESDGSFGFDGLVARPYTLVARSSLGAGGPVTAQLTASSDPVVIRLGPAGAVRVRVVDSEERPLAASVELRGLDLQQATSGSDGRAVLTPVVPGRYDVVAQAKGFAPSFVSVSVPAAPVDVTMVLKIGSPVSGTVVDTRGTPVLDALVVYTGASDWNIRPDARRDGVRTGIDGRFRVEALPAGSVRLVARHPAHAPGTSAIITLDGVTPRADVEIRLAEGAAVSGRVIDGAGAPVASSRVRIGVASRDVFGADPRETIADDRGAFTVRGLPRRALEAVALADRGASATVSLDASGGDVSGLELVVDVTGTIAGVVVDTRGEPLEGIQVSAIPDLRAGTFDLAEFRLRGFSQELTDAGGRFELVGLTPGSYLVRAARGPRKGLALGFEGESARTGTRDLRIVLPGDGAIVGKVAFADGTVPTPFTVGLGAAQEPVFTKDGSFELTDVPPRKHQLSVRGLTIDQKIVEVEVEEGETADVGTVVVGRGRSISGRVLFEGRPVAEATVLAGRQIFGTGSTSAAPAGAGGPPGRGNNRSVTTDENGRFTIGGLGPSDVAVVAEHPDLGRSTTLRVPRGDPSETSLVLDLLAFGVLRGKATDVDGPVADTVVTAQSVTAANALFTVTTGADGTFRFDRLAPDLYKVSAMLGTPLSGMTFHSVQARVESRREVTANLSVQKGQVTLSVAARARAGAFRGGFSWLISGVVAARTGRELNQIVAAHESGTETLGILFGDNPAVYRDVVPGAYTVCVGALPAEISGPAQGQAYIERHGDDLPVSCKGALVTPAPRQQNIAIDVEIPPLAAD